MFFFKYLGNNLLSKLSLLLSLLVIGFFVFFHLPINAFSFDVFGYYLYLPLTLKYNNLDIHNFDMVQAIITKYNNTEFFYQAFKLESGNWVLKYPMGMSVMYFPFYLVGDLLAAPLGYLQDGFSVPYQISVLTGCYIYSIFGLAVLRKILLYFFSDKISAVVLLLVVFGTNYFFHVSFHGQSLMSHNILFMLHAFTVWNTIRWHDHAKIKYLIYTGVSIGLSAIVRPTEIIVILFPLLYGVSNLDSLKHKLAMVFKTYRLQFMLMFVIVFVIASYQLFYWKIITGEFLFNSYSSNPAEAMNFLHPYILEVLFSFRKGWLIYTPIMLLALIGLLNLYKKNKSIFFSLILYVLINFYIVSSWSCWWYASSYSSRALIPSYIFMALPLGFFFRAELFQRFKILFISIILSLLALNLFQTWQSCVGILDGARMTRQFYKSIFFQTKKLSDEQKQLLLIDKYGMSSETFADRDASKYKIAYSNTLSFEENAITNDSKTNLVFYSGQYSVVTNQSKQFSPGISKRYKDLSNSSYAWIKATAWFYSNNEPDSLSAALVINMTHNDVSYKYRAEPVANHNFKKGTWNKIEKYFLTPDFMDKNDKIHVFFWNQSDKDIFIDDLKVEVLEPIIDETVF